MKHVIAVLLLASCAQPVPAAVEHQDGSVTLSKQEVETTIRNFNGLIELVNVLKEKLRVLEESKMCKGV